MSIFAKDIVSNSDSVVLKEYNLGYDVDTRTEYLYELDHGWYPRKTFVPGRYLWILYIGEVMDDIFKLGNDVEKFINEEDFLLYIKNSSLTNKLEFKGETWYEKRYLWPVFEAYNDHVAEMCLKWRHEQSTNKKLL